MRSDAELVFPQARVGKPTQRPISTGGREDSGVTSEAACPSRASVRPTACGNSEGACSAACPFIPQQPLISILNVSRVRNTLITPGSTGRNTLVCFTSCRLALEDGALVARDLWIDEERGVILDAQKTFFEDGFRPDTTVGLGGDILRTVAPRRHMYCTPGFVDMQINGAYGFDFSIFHNADAAAYEAGVCMVARKIVETGVTSLLPTIIPLSHPSPPDPAAFPLSRHNVHVTRRSRPSIAAPQIPLPRLAPAQRDAAVFFLALALALEEWCCRRALFCGAPRGVYSRHGWNGMHEWRDGKRLVKEGVKMYIAYHVSFASHSCLNIGSRKGTQRPGANADLVRLDKAGCVKAAWVGWRRVWEGAGAAA
ncbi:hypothetical protein JB92DRAFT_3096970 [Gautieria morchelliformis]|nr:hypothetical protein JB92DRAFT_3096970 [Gautieria morchelliformis]